MKKIKVAIIDSGVREDHPLFKDKKPNVIRLNHFSTEGRCGHGTAIYNIIRKVEHIADIINFQITNEEEEIIEDMLIECLELIYNEYYIDVINISLGLSLCDNDYLVKLKTICSKLTNRGTIIVSAFDNLGSFSYPAVFENVIGVVSMEECRKNSDFIFFDDEVINIGANGNTQRLAWDKPDYLIFNGNSFACAYVTVQVVKFLNEGYTIQKDIIDKFKQEFNNISFEDKYYKLCKRPNYKINKAVIFPFNKEMHSLIRYLDLLPFHISNIYDIRESSRVGSTTEHLLKGEILSMEIENYKNIEWDIFDTVILGNIPNRNTNIYHKAREHIIS